MNNKWITIRQLIDEINESKEVPDLIITPFVQGKDDAGKEIFVAEQYKYSYSVRFVKTEITEEEYMDFIADKIYYKKISDLTREEIDLSKHTIFFLKKDYTEYKKSLLYYLKYIEKKRQDIIKEFTEYNLELSKSQLDVILEILTIGNFKDAKFEEKS